MSSHAEGPPGSRCLSQREASPVDPNSLKERSTPMAYSKMKARKRSRFTLGPDVAKAKTPKAVSPHYVNAALAMFALIGLATFLTA